MNKTKYYYDADTQSIIAQQERNTSAWLTALAFFCIMAAIWFMAIAMQLAGDKKALQNKCAKLQSKDSLRNYCDSVAESVYDPATPVLIKMGKVKFENEH